MTRRCRNFARNEVSISGRQTIYRDLAKLQPSQRRSAVKAYKIFKQNPFDPRLRTHKIHRLSAQSGKTIYSVYIEADLRAVFYIEKDIVWSVSIGTHAIYRGG